MITPTLSSPASILARQIVEEDGRQIHWWYSETGRIVKWSVFLGLILILSIYIVGGYIHARSRIKKGLAPLGYHRWLVRRSDLARVDPRYAYPPAMYHPRAPGWTTHRPADAYHMRDMGVPPPPVYDPTSSRPPMYSPPEGGSKVNPAQGWGQQESGTMNNDYAPPSGPPPPAAVATHGTGNTNPFLR